MWPTKIPIPACFSFCRNRVNRVGEITEPFLVPFNIGNVSKQELFHFPFIVEWVYMLSNSLTTEEPTPFLTIFWIASCVKVYRKALRHRLIIGTTLLQTTVELFSLNENCKLLVYKPLISLFSRVLSETLPKIRLSAIAL